MLYLLNKEKIPCVSLSPFGSSNEKVLTTKISRSTVYSQQLSPYDVLHQHRNDKQMDTTNHNRSLCPHEVKMAQVMQPTDTGIHTQGDYKPQPI